MGKKGQGDGRIFEPTPIVSLLAGKQCPVDLYIRTATDTYVLYRAAHTPLKKGTFQRLRDRGIEILYIDRGQKEDYDDYMAGTLRSVVSDTKLPERRKNSLIYSVSEEVMKGVLAHPRSGRSLNRVRPLVDATVQTILKNPESLWQMTEMAGHHYRTYTHSLNVSLFLLGATHAILDIDDQARLKPVGLGAMLHDLGKSAIPESLLSKPGKLTTSEFQSIKKHPVLGVRLARRTLQLQPDCEQIIRGHHERCDGSGYPGGKTAKELGEIVKLASIVDAYDALTTDRSYAPAKSPFDALKIMLQEPKEHFDSHLLEEFIRFLGSSDTPAERQQRHSPQRKGQKGPDWARERSNPTRSAPTA